MHILFKKKKKPYGYKESYSQTHHEDWNLSIINIEKLKWLNTDYWYGVGILIHFSRE